MEIIDRNLLTDEKRVAMSAVEFESKFQTQVIEDTEMFLFKTIQPFCETVTLRKVMKKDLEQALVKYYPKSRIYDKGNWLCPSCSCQVYGEQKYCDSCGQHMEKIEM